MVRAAVFLIAALCASPAGWSREWKELRLATEGGYPPFSETHADGSLHGLDVDIGNALCAELRLRCTWVKQEWASMIPALISRKFDAIVASMSITEERKAWVDFTDKYYASPLALVARKGSGLEPDVRALSGKTVGVGRATVADHFATRFWEGRGVEIIRYPRQDECYIDLAAGRIDATLADYWESRGGFLDRPEGSQFAVAGRTIYGKTAEERAIIGEGIGIAVRKQDQDLRQLLNHGLARIRANGTYARIVGRYFAEDIYGD
jgi:histidine transport system substrate-binding protein